MAVFYGNSTTNSNYRGRLEMWESATDVANNTSTISWTFKVFRADNYNSSFDRSYGNNFTLIADGSARTSPSPYTNFRAWMGTNGRYESTANTWTSGSFTINHNADGSKSFYFEAKYWNTDSDSVGSSSKPLTVGGTFYCTSFPRASTVYPNYTEVTLGNTVGINVTRASSSFTHFIYWRFDASHTGTIGTNVTTYTEWTPNLATFAPLITQSSTHAVTVVCDTYNGNTLVGSSTCAVNLRVPQTADTLPTLNVAYSPVNGFRGHYLQGYSKCQFTMTATAKLGATIASYRINDVTTTANPYTTGVLSGTGSITYNVTAYDSRGFSSTTVPVTITVDAYFLPRMEDISVYRCTSNGTASSSGTYLRCYAKAVYASVADNSASMSVTWKKATDASYGTASTLQSETALIVGGGNISVQYAYSVKLTITDTVGNTVDVVLTIPSDSVAINAKKNNKGVAVGAYAIDDNIFKVNSDWLIDTRGIKPVGFTVMTRQRQPSGAGDYCHYQRLGNLILVQFSGGITSGTADGNAIGTGLPSSVSEAYGAFAISGQKCAQVSVNGTELRWRDSTLSADIWAWGQIIYVTSE